MTKKLTSGSTISLNNKSETKKRHMYMLSLRMNHHLNKIESLYSHDVAILHYIKEYRDLLEPYHKLLKNEYE